MKKILSAFVFVLMAPHALWAACLPTDLCAKITGINDTPLGTWGGSGDMTTNYTLCVYVQNDDESNYEVTATGDGAGNTFIATNGTSDISFTVDWQEDTDPGWTNLAENVATIFPNPNTSDENCAVGGDSAKIRVTVPQSVMEYTTSGSYSGNINLLISPD